MNRSATTRHGLHDADEVVGRITTRGEWDRRYKPKPDPCQDVDDGGWREVIAGLFVLGLLGIAFWLWMAIGAAAQ